MSGDLLRAALDYAARGWPVFPCRPGSKSPLFPSPHPKGSTCGGECGLLGHGYRDATTDPAVIRAWWARCPTANVGIATGDPGPDVIDFDVTAGKPGPVTYRRLRDAGMLTGAHLVVATPSGGRHLYYAGTGQGNGAMPRHGVDFRARGGYVLAPPSSVGGRPYTTLRAHPAHRAVADFAAVRALLDPPRPIPTRPRLVGDGCDELIRWVGGQQEGNRNNALYWAALKAGEEGADGSVFAALVAAGITTGLPEHEVRRTVTSARRRAAA